MNATKISVYLLKSEYEGTNGGMTSRLKEFNLYRDRAAYDADDEAKPHCSLVCVHRKIGIFSDGADYVHAEPAIKREDKCYMAGGNFVYTCDSRYFEVTSIRYPISVHDRTE